ncbi:MAG TPA: BrnT family toxin [Kofleriaceae bacterium]|nr:BrnT family toxin [Kofleriaceae bacterium]
MTYYAVGLLSSLVPFDWDPTKDEANRRRHGLSFDDAKELFASANDYLELFDESHSDEEERFIAIGPDRIRRCRRRLDGAPRRYDPHHRCTLCHKERDRAFSSVHGARAMTDPRELTSDDFGRAIKASVRKRLMRGEIKSGDDIVALRKCVGLTQDRFAEALGISVHTLRNWEQGRRWPEGPALALLRIAARHPRILRENVGAAA